jgi:hypothetical protein
MDLLFDGLNGEGAANNTQNSSVSPFYASQTNDYSSPPSSSSSISSSNMLVAPTEQIACFDDFILDSGWPNDGLSHIPLLDDQLASSSMFGTHQLVLNEGEDSRDSGLSSTTFMPLASSASSACSAPRTQSDSSMASSIIDLTSSESTKQTCADNGPGK